MWIGWEEWPKKEKATRWPDGSPDIWEARRKALMNYHKPPMKYVKSDIEGLRRSTVNVENLPILYVLTVCP